MSRPDRRRRSALVVATLASAIANSVHAEVLALEGATVHTISGPVLEGATVVIGDDGVITAVGVDVDVPADARRVDLSGHRLYPGLLNLGTMLGIWEIRDVQSTRDESELGQINPNLRPEVAFNPASELLPVARADGVLAFLTYPTSGLITGTAALATTAGRYPESMVVRAPVAMVINWPSMRLDHGSDDGLSAQREARLDRIAELDRAFDDATGYLARRAVDDAVPVDVKWEAMRPVLDGEIPVLARTWNGPRVRAALDWAEERELDLILAASRDLAPFADELAARGVPVILDGLLLGGPPSDGPFDALMSQPAALHAAGVRIAFGTGMSPYGTYNARQLPDLAGRAVGHGLPREAAVRAITLDAAIIAGVGDRLGSIEVGKEATLIATDGDVLEIRTHVTHAWIAGREQALATRHTRLYEAYRLR